MSDNDQAQINEILATHPSRVTVSGTAMLQREVDSLRRDLAAEKARADGLDRELKALKVLLAWHDSDDTVERVADALKAAGWRATADAQWEGLRHVMPSIAACFSAPVAASAEVTDGLIDWLNLCATDCDADGQSYTADMHRKFSAMLADHSEGALGMVPEEVTVSMVKNSSYAEGWNDCRAAMLAAAQQAPRTPDQCQCNPGGAVTEQCMECPR